MLSGSVVNIWKQDPSVSSVGHRPSFTLGNHQPGHKNDLIKIVGMPEVLPNANNDFLFSPKENPQEFDAVHTYAVVQKVITIVERAMNRIGIQQPFQWQWGEDPIRVFPRAGFDKNAFYSRSERSLRFFFFDDRTGPVVSQVFTCQSWDIVAHETGHAILDALQSGYLSSNHIHTGGLHESFGDLIAIFTLLSQLDMCELVIAESKADLHNKTFFQSLAEEFGRAQRGHDMGLRNADNDLKLSEVPHKVHAISQVFTGAIYDILADFFDDHLDAQKFDPAESLFRVGQYLFGLLLEAIIIGPNQNATYKDIAEQMIQLEKEPARKEIIRKHFDVREVFDSQTLALHAKVQNLDFSKCCGTLKN